MKQTSTRSILPTSQQDLFRTPSNQSASKSISVYRVCLVKDATVSFGQSFVSNSHQAHALIQNLILDPRAAGQGTVCRRLAKRQERNNRTEHCFRGSFVIDPGSST